MKKRGRSSRDSYHARCRAQTHGSANAEFLDLSVPVTLVDLGTRSLVTVMEKGVTISIECLRGQIERQQKTTDGPWSMHRYCVFRSSPPAADRGHQALWRGDAACSARGKATRRKYIAHRSDIVSECGLLCVLQLFSCVVWSF